MRWIGSTLGLLVALSLACKAPPPQSGGAGDSGEPKPAPDLVLTTIDGSGTISLAEQKGKVVLVDLWATWCAPCIAELPHLQEMSDRFGADDFLMLGIVLESGDASDIQEFVAEREVRYRQVLGEDGTKESFGPFLGYPTKYLIDREGLVVKRYFGVREDVASDVETLINTGFLPTD